MPDMPLGEYVEWLKSRKEAEESSKTPETPAETPADEEAATETPAAKGFTPVKRPGSVGAVSAVPPSENREDVIPAWAPTPGNDGMDIGREVAQAGFGRSGNDSSLWVTGAVPGASNRGANTPVRLAEMLGASSFLSAPDPVSEATDKAIAYRRDLHSDDQFDEYMDGFYNHDDAMHHLGMFLDKKLLNDTLGHLGGKESSPVSPGTNQESASKFDIAEVIRHLYGAGSKDSVEAAYKRSRNMRAVVPDRHSYEVRDILENEMGLDPDNLHTPEHFEAEKKAMEMAWKRDPEYKRGSAKRTGLSNPDPAYPDKYIDSHRILTSSGKDINAHILNVIKALDTHRGKFWTPDRHPMLQNQEDTRTGKEIFLDAMNYGLHPQDKTRGWLEAHPIQQMMDMAERALNYTGEFKNKKKLADMSLTEAVRPGYEKSNSAIVKSGLAHSLWAVSRFFNGMKRNPYLSGARALSDIAGQMDGNRIGSYEGPEGTRPLVITDATQPVEILRKGAARRGEEPGQIAVGLRNVVDEMQEAVGRGTEPERAQRALDEEAVRALMGPGARHLDQRHVDAMKSMVDALDTVNEVEKKGVQVTQPLSSGTSSEYSNALMQYLTHLDTRGHLLQSRWVANQDPVERQGGYLGDERPKGTPVRLVSKIDLPSAHDAMSYSMGLTTAAGGPAQPIAGRQVKQITPEDAEVARRNLEIAGKQTPDLGEILDPATMGNLLGSMNVVNRQLSNLRPMDQKGENASAGVPQTVPPIAIPGTDRTIPNGIPASRIRQTQDGLESSAGVSSVNRALGNASGFGNLLRGLPTDGSIPAPLNNAVATNDSLSVLNLPTTVSKPSAVARMPIGNFLQQLGWDSSQMPDHPAPEGFDPRSRVTHVEFRPKPTHGHPYLRDVEGTRPDPNTPGMVNTQKGFLAQPISKTWVPTPHEGSEGEGIPPTSRDQLDQNFLTVVRDHLRNHLGLNENHPEWHEHMAAAVKALNDHTRAPNGQELLDHANLPDIQSRDFDGTDTGQTRGFPRNLGLSPDSFTHYDKELGDTAIVNTSNRGLNRTGIDSDTIGHVPYTVHFVDGYGNDVTLDDSSHDLSVLGTDVGRRGSVGVDESRDTSIATVHGSPTNFRIDPLLPAPGSARHGQYNSALVDVRDPAAPLSTNRYNKLVDQANMDTDGPRIPKVDSIGGSKWTPPSVPQPGVFIGGWTEAYKGMNPEAQQHVRNILISGDLKKLHESHPDSPLKLSSGSKTHAGGLTRDPRKEHSYFAGNSSKSLYELANHLGISTDHWNKDHVSEIHSLFPMGTESTVKEGHQNTFYVEHKSEGISVPPEHIGPGPGTGRTNVDDLDAKDLVPGMVRPTAVPEDDFVAAQMKAARGRNAGFNTGREGK